MIKITGRNCLRPGSAFLFTGRVIMVFCVYGFLCAFFWQAANALQNDASTDVSNELQLRQRQIRDAFHERLESLARTCLEQDMPKEAGLARAAVQIRDPQRQYVFMPPAVTPSFVNSANDRQKQFHRRLVGEKQGYAKELFQLAEFAAENLLGVEAYQLFHETLVFDPQHEAARKVLGFRKHDELGWVRSAKPTRANKARTPQKTIGWQKGTYWEVNSPHFKIYSAAGRDEGLKLAAELEQTYWVWRQVFFDYWSTPRSPKKWLEGDGSDKSGKRQYEVILFRDRDQYLSDLAEVPNIGRSSGYYDEKKRASLFYAAADPPIETWRHEIIHQLLQENAGPNKTVADRGHAWLVEGVAMYFESMQVHDDYVTLGGFDATRLQYARLRCKREGFFMPLELLDSMDREELQHHEDVGRLYSQASGISQFLFAADEGRHRNAFINFIKEFYKERRIRSTLADQTMELDQLDRKYKQFLDVTSTELANHFLNRDASALALGRAGLKDDDVAILKDCTRLQWLELSANKLGDDAIDHLENLPEITQLFLDETGITDASANNLANLKTLQELDLASTRISDVGVKELVALPQLQVLWLAGSKVTNECVDSLSTMPKLQLVDLRKTGVTAAAVEKLKAAKPDLQVMH